MLWVKVAKLDLLQYAERHNLPDKPQDENEALPSGPEPHIGRDELLLAKCSVFHDELLQV